MDFIDIVGLEVEGIIGVKPEERDTPQPLVIFTTIGMSFDDIKEDDISTTIDYESVTDFIAEFTSNQSFYLIETFAQHLIKQLFERYHQCQFIRLRVEKPQAIPAANTIAVEVKRERL